MANINKNKEWMESFNKRVAHIELEFDSFLLAGTLQDYYVLQQDKQTGTLMLDLCGDKKLPKQVADALTQAFMDTRPTTDQL